MVGDFKSWVQWFQTYSDYFTSVHHSPFDSVPAGQPGAWFMASSKHTPGWWPLRVGAPQREAGNNSQQGTRAEVGERGVGWGCNILPTEGWMPGGYGGEHPGSHPSNLNTQSPPNSLVQTLWAWRLPGWQSQHVIVYRRFIVKNWKQPRYPSTDWTNCGTSIPGNATQQWKWTNCWYTQQSQWISRELYWMKKPNHKSYILMIPLI